MQKAPAPLSSDPGLPFRYVGGDASVDLVNTVDWTERGLENDRLTDYERLTRWAEGAGVVTPREAASLRREAVAQPRQAWNAHQAAIRLRWVLQRLYGALAAGERPGPALDDFNILLTAALRHLRIESLRQARGTKKLADWRWDDAERLDSLLRPVLWAAAALLTSEEAHRLRVCAGPDCGWMYVDRSRNRLRRWCQMETCGTAEKSRRRWERGRVR